jgi:CubicO group peptidase (beta-lactamase class C family)
MNQLIPTLTAVFLLMGCDGDSSEPPPPPNDGQSDAFAAVDEAARLAFEEEGIPGGLTIYNRQSEKVFERMYGDFSADRRVPIASASKIVSGVVIFRLIDQGFLSLDSTTGEVLGWTGASAGITVRHLLSFTSGLPKEVLCTYSATTTLADCVSRIEEIGLEHTPGTVFEYGSTHLHVAGRMAEVTTGSQWNEIFASQLLAPLGLPADLVYYANPVAMAGTQNPLLAGGLHISMNEYARILRFIFDKGVWEGSPLLAPEIFDAQTITPFPNAEVRFTPAESPNLRYGLTAWLECATPATGCATISSPGAFGFTPWLDRSAGYYAILGMDFSGSRDEHQAFGVELQQKLKCLIENALEPGLEHCVTPQ